MVVQTEFMYKIDSSVLSPHIPNRSQPNLLAESKHENIRYSMEDSLVFKEQFSSWRINWAKLGRTLRQCVHISRLPVWIRKWAYSVVLCGNVLSQWSQLNGRSPETINTVCRQTRIIIA